jgi:hypothetical protein
MFIVRIAERLFWFTIFIVSLIFWALIIYRTWALFWLLLVGLAILVGMAFIIDKYSRP